ncbi:MAG: hypothetical protein NTX45_26945 [Proteobacteria bacterium]|nr:hypothetical protein [Pseudomonadota bacterium]
MSPLSKLPCQYHVLPHTAPFHIPGFKNNYRVGNMTFSPGEMDTEEWFEIFTERVLASVGNAYLPICRLSDGEFTVLLGQQPWYMLGPVSKRLRHWVGYLYRKLFTRRFKAATWVGVSSGDYSHREIQEFRNRYTELLLQIAGKGMLAMHLSYGQFPFQEQFFPALKKWLDRNGLVLTYENYTPFYFVYALLTGPKRHALFQGRRVLLVNGADREKQQRIEQSLFREGVSSVDWCPISRDRSFYDQIDTTPWQNKVDLVLVGAGVGKPNILLQLQPLNVPVIDAGFVFEVWADPDRRWHRPVCVPDDEYIPALVKFLPPNMK